MTNDLTDKYRLGIDPELGDDIDLRPSAYVAYRIDPQERPANAMLDLWFHNGNQRAIAYMHLYAIEFEPSQGMRLTFSEHLVTIRGYRLNELYRYLKRQRIAFIWEATPPEKLLAQSQPCITAIVVKPRFENPSSLPPE